MFRIKHIDVDAGEYTVILNSTDAYEMGVRSLDRVKISSKKHSITAIVELSDTILKPNEIGLLSRCFKDLKEKEGAEVDISPASRPISIEYSKKLKEIYQILNSQRM
jgi:anaerobic selenocysteine-containing dehydrogenase